MSDRDRALPTLGSLAETYEIVRELGRGGTAVVYLARDHDLQRDVAIKVIRSTFVEDEEAMARLVREARTVAGLQHPNIVMLYGTQRLEDDSFALVMQYVPGRSLKDLIRAQGALTCRQAGQILVDVARALAYAHGRRIVHRDIKPENIYLDQDLGLARLSDFGIARAWDSDANLTLPGMALGTPAYMSPEQIDGGDLDGRSDLFSLGLVGYEMLTGQQPWAGDNLYNVIYRQKQEDLPPLGEVRPDAPPHLQRAIHVALEKDQSRRWANAQDFIQQVLSGHLPDTPPPENIPRLVESGSPEATDEDAATIMYRRLEPLPEDIGLDGDGADGKAEEGRGVAPPVPAPPLPGADPTGAGPPPAPRRRRRVVGVSALGVVVLGAGLAWGALNAGVDGSPEPAGLPLQDVEVADASGPPADAQLPGNPPAGDASQAAVPDPAPPEPPAAPVPALLQVYGGDGQAAEPGVRLSEPLVVQVRDEAGVPVSGATVRFEVAEGGGFVSPPLAVTDEQGLASSQWMLGMGAGPQELRATVQGLAGVAALFTAELEAPAPVQPGRVALVAGSGQRAPLGATLSQPVVVQVDDADGVPLANVAVRFNVLRGGGTVRPVRAVTDAVGRAQATWTLGTAGVDNAVRVVVEALEDRPVDVTATGVAPSLPVRRAVVAGGTHTCALTRDGTAYCWGGNQSGQLGKNGDTRRSTPGLVDGTLALAVVSAGFRHTCGLTSAGQAFCWGANDDGQLGDGSTSSRSEPARVAGDVRFSEVLAGLTHTCALAQDGTAYCWGLNGNGQLGDGTRASRSAPGQAGSRLRFTALAVGWSHTCGLSGGDAWCWGRNAHGQLGDGTGADRLEPVRVAGGHRFVALSAGSAHTCGVTVDGDAWCWGQNTYGQLGDDSNQNRSEPVQVADLSDVSQVVAGGVHTCALTRSGAAYCWGRNTYGQLGDSTSQDRAVPVAVQGGITFTDVFASGAHTCGATAAGRSYCWGYNSDGQLGDGSRADRSVPTQVLRLPR